MKRGLFNLCLAAATLFAEDSRAAELEIPVALDYRILDQALVEQVFTGPDATAELFSDRLHCNALTLSEPHVTGTDDSQVRVVTRMQARTGTPIGDRCLFAKTWNGIVETEQTAHADPTAARISFRIVDSRLLSAEDGTDVLPGFMRGWLRDYVHPRLGAVTIDLEPALSGIREVLDAVAADARIETPADLQPMLASLRLADIRPFARELVAVLALEVPAAPTDWAPAAEAPFTEQELAAWDAAWQTWDGFATWTIKMLALTAAPELTTALAETLLEARHDLRDALTRDERDRDPVRALFLKTWERLAPLVADLQSAMPGGQAMRYATFVSAGNALQALDQLAPHLGLRLDRNGLRSLARALVPGVSDYEWRYDTAVDPELRMLLGFPAEFEATASDGSGIINALVSWLIRSAHAAMIDPDLAERLNSWVPARREIDRYLETVESLLEAIAQAERGRGKVPAEHFGTYDALLQATAFQESCWRQYVERAGAIETIRSAAGSVGLMQVNMHVWRGVYDIDALHGDIAYNARAGNEILVHYLVDYAIRKGEGEVADTPDSLARATYAVYNGGPRHLTRYRNPNASATLKKIDNAFWAKYRAIQSEGPAAVKRCLAG